MSVLRTHATVAASLLSIYTSSSSSAASANGSSASPLTPAHDEGLDDDDDATARGTDDEAEQQAGRAPTSDPRQAPTSTATTADGGAPKPLTIAVQVSGSTVIIRRLKCGLLLVCVGRSEQDAQNTASGASGSSSAGGAAAAAAAAGEGGVAAVTQALESADLLNATVSETESQTSAGGQTSTSNDSGVSPAMRAHARELARWLDAKLGTLTVPEDSTGAE